MADFKFRAGSDTVTVRETLLDRAIRWADPMLARRRLAARVGMAYALAGGYEGGRRDKRGLSSWQPRNGSADADLLPDLPTLRDRSRDLVRNSPLAHGAVNTATVGAIGTGLMPKPAPQRVLLGWDEERAAQWKARVELEWALWAESTDCDLTRTQNFYGLQDLAYRSAKENGDVFGLLPMVARPGAAYELAVQLIEADRVSNPDGKPDTATVAGGIEVDQYGAPRVCHITNRHPGDRLGAATKWTPYQVFSESGWRRNVLHHYTRRRVGQSRGVPWLAAALPAFRNLGRYTDAELFAAVANAMFAVKTKTDGRGGLSPLESAVSGQTPTTGTADSAQGSNWDGTLTEGLVVDLGRDEDITSFNAGRPNPEFDPFVQAILRQIGVSLGLPFEVLIKHFTASYSAARSALLEAWKFFRCERALFADTWCQPVYVAWMAEAVARGRIEAPGFFDDPLLRYAYTCVNWHGDGMGSINPKDEAEAAETRMRIHLTTLDQEKAEYDGGDAASTIEQAGREQKMKVKAGLPPPANTGPGRPPQPAPNRDQPDQT